MNNEHFKPTFLYIKTHNKTGLKYFGKTVSSDPEKYKGSGIYWTNHIEKHGNDVSTEIYGFYTDREACLQDAIQFSEEHNIVSSDEWANLIPETVDTINGIVLSNKNIYGKNGQSGYGLENLLPSKDIIKILKDRGEYEKYCKKMSKSIKEAHSSGKLISNLKTNNPMLNKESKEKQKESFKNSEHQRGKLNSQYGTCWITSNDRSKHIKIKKELLNEYYEQGWFIGRLKLLAPHLGNDPS